MHPGTRLAVLSGATAATLSLTVPAASGQPDWDDLAACESGGDWNATSPSGQYRGGLQHSQETWDAYGGEGDPADASREEQIEVAGRVLAGQGPGAWPTCSARTGAFNGSTQGEVSAPEEATADVVVESEDEVPAPEAGTESTAEVTVSGPADYLGISVELDVALAAAGPPAFTAWTPPAGVEVYIVAEGDTLAALSGGPWDGLYLANSAKGTGVVEHPDKIWPGELLVAVPAR